MYYYREEIGQPQCANFFVRIVVRESSDTQTAFCSPRKKRDDSGKSCCGKCGEGYAIHPFRHAARHKILAVSCFFGSPGQLQIRRNWRGTSSEAFLSVPISR